MIHRHAKPIFTEIVNIAIFKIDSRGLHVALRIGYDLLMVHFPVENLATTIIR